MTSNVESVSKNAKIKNAKNKKPNKFLSCIKKHKFLTIGISLLVVLVIVGSVALASFLSIYSANKISSLGDGIIGSDVSVVEKKLGKPSEKSTNSLYYYSNDFKKAKENNNTEKLQKLEYNFIQVIFDSNNKVESIIFDAKHKYEEVNGIVNDKATVKKVGTKIAINKINLEQNKGVGEYNNDIVYSVTYKDGSYIKSKLTEVVCDTSNLTNDKDNVTTNDFVKASFTDINSWGTYDVDMKVKTENSLFFDSAREEIVGKKLTTYTIPNDRTEIPAEAFKDCVSLNELIMGDSIVSIGDYAFSGCTKITKFILSNKITTIGEFAFDKCKALTDMVLPESVTTIKKFAFHQCVKMTSITIPNSVVNMGRGVFYECRKLTINLDAPGIPELIDNATTGWDTTWNESKCKVVLKVE